MNLENNRMSQKRGKPLSRERRVEEYTTSSEKETFLVARKMAKSLKGHEVILLFGNLGAGKTVFAKGTAAGLGIEDVNYVCSPSFTLINIYQGRCPIFHVDLYRLNNAAEARGLGWEDYIGQGIILVEWAEKLEFHGEAIRVHIMAGDGDTRKIKIFF